MDPIITYRMTATGIWNYHFYTGQQMLGKVSCTLSLLSTVRVETDSFSWYSAFHADTMVFPGVSRKVMDDRNNREVFRIVFCEPGYYRLMDREKSLLVEYRENAYLFGNPGQPALAVTERITEWPWVPEGEPFFRTTVFEDKPEEELLTAMLAFPALRF